MPGFQKEKLVKTYRLNQLNHRIREAERSGADTVEVPPHTTLQDLAMVIAEFNRGRSVQAPHAVFENILPSGAGLVRFVMLIP